MQLHPVHSTITLPTFSLTEDAGLQLQRIAYLQQTTGWLHATAKSPDDGQLMSEPSHKRKEMQRKSATQPCQVLVLCWTF
jgi:C1A family cysteine protease